MLQLPVTVTIKSFLEFSCSCPEQRYLDRGKLQELINGFTRQIINPCWEPIHHPRPDATGIYQLNSSFYSDR
jgi:hypothetical protein